MSDFYCACGDDTYEVYRTKRGVSRKDRRCEECRGPIKAGDLYEYAFGVYYGDGYSHHTCERCADLATWMRNNIPCFCWSHGSLFEGVIETAREAQSALGAEVAGLHFGALRRIQQIRRQNAEPHP